MRKTLWVLSIGLLFLTGVLGPLNCIREMSDARNLLQGSVYAGSLLYGVVGLVAGWQLIRHRRAAVTLCSIWAVTITYVATVATFAFTPTLSTSQTMPGTVAAFVSCALLGAGVVWVARRSVDPAAAPASR